MAVCTRCRELVSRVYQADSANGDPDSSVAATLVAGSTEAGAPDFGFDEALPAGTEIGRYTVGERVGSGGMGIVYAARDRDLDRNVAIKILRGGARRADHDDRLLREARAMAQLAHPNAVAVFEVGRYREQVFLAMELVDGWTLAEWLAAKPRGRRKIVEVFEAAGRGLAAAHAAGLVHRDFKPANVLVGRDGRVRVTDFGLVLVQDGATASAGGLIGTPQYMAPEQLRGAPADARSDQFAFCVALYRALYGESPFDGDTLAELAQSVTAGRLRSPRRGPRWLARIVARGLSAAPDQRWPSMDALLAALTRDPYRWPRRVGVAAALVSIAVAVALVVPRPSSPLASCRELASRIAPAWTTDSQQRVSRAFAATDKPYAQAALAEVGRTLDGYQNTLTEMRVDLCEATRAAPAATDELLGLRGACLDRQQSELRALVGILATASPDVVEHAPRAASELPDIRDCADARALLGPARPPSDPAARTRIDQLRDKLAAASAQRRVGHFPQALEQARALVDDARASHYRPLEAEVESLIGMAAYDAGQYRDAEPALKAAVFAAEAGKADEVAARTLIQLMAFEGQVNGHPAQAAADYAPRIRALLERLDGSVVSDELEGRMHAMLSSLAMYANQHAEADRESRLALEVVERRFGPADLRITAALWARIWALLLRNDGPAALVLSQRMLAIDTRAYGDDHPDVSTAYSFVAMSLEHTERTGEARPAFERALAIRERTLGPEHPEVSDALVEFAEYEQAIGHYRAALADDQRALPIVIKTAGKTCPQYGETRLWMAQILDEQGRFAEAQAALAEARPILTATLGEDSISMSDEHMIAASVLGHLRRFAEARREIAASQAIFDRLFPPDHPQHALRYRVLGQIELAAGGPREALAAFERASALLSPHDGSLGLVRAEIDFGTARALGELGQDRPRARQLAEAARTSLASCAECATSAQQIDRWLASHPAKPR